MTGNYPTKRKKSAMLCESEHATKHQALQQAINITGSQEKLSNLIGTSASQIQNWYNRKDRIPFDAAFLITIFTHVSLEKLAPYSPCACYMLMRHFRKVILSLTIVDTDTVKCMDGFAVIDDEDAGPKDNLHRPIMIDGQNQLIYGGHQLNAAKKHHKRNQIPAIRIDLRQLKATGELTLLHPQGWIKQELKALEQYFKYLLVKSVISNVPEIHLDDDGSYMNITS